MRNFDWIILACVGMLAVSQFLAYTVRQALRRQADSLQMQVDLHSQQIFNLAESGKLQSECIRQLSAEDAALRERFERESG